MVLDSSLSVDYLMSVVRSWAALKGFKVRISPHETPCGVHWAGKLLEDDRPVWFGFTRKAETLLWALCLDMGIEVRR